MWSVLMTEMEVRVITFVYQVIYPQLLGIFFFLHQVTVKGERWMTKSFDDGEKFFSS